MICQSCGGIVGRDCFNPEECAAIGFAQEQAARHENQQQHFTIEQRIAIIESRLDRLELQTEQGPL